MAFAGTSELLVLFATLYNSPTHDLASLIAADDYFRSRKIAVKAEGLAELAVKDPSDPKTQLQQLLALRWLGEHPAEVKKVAAARAALEAVGAGKKAQDRHGFARLYARQALARLEGRSLPAAATAPAKSLTGEAFAWFPARTNLCAGVELRAPAATLTSGKDPVAEMVRRLMRPRDREELYKVAELLGNVRVDRLAVGITLDANGDMLRATVRVTGAGDHKRLASLIRRELRPALDKEEKGPGGEPITLLGHNALIGDTDLVFVAFEGGKAAQGALRETLEARAGKRKGVPDGPLAKLLKDAPAGARSLFAAELNEKTRAKALRQFQPLPALPQRVLAYVVRQGTGDVTKEGKLGLHVQGVMKDAAEAKAAAAAVEKLKQQGLDQLKKLPAEEKIPPGLPKALTETLSGLKVAATGPRVRLDLPIPKPEALLDAVNWLLAPGPEPKAIPEKPK